MSQMLELAALVVGNLPKDMDPRVVQSWINNPKELRRFLTGLHSPDTRSEVVFQLDWTKVYEVLGKAEAYREFATSLLDGRDVEGKWLIPVLRDITINQVIAALKKAGVNVTQDTHDLGQDINDRDPNYVGSYFIAVGANIQADEDQKNKSADQLKEEGHEGITLLERLLLELAYFLTTGKHLDKNVWTLCAGSRRSNGYVPRVYGSSDNRGICIYWCYSSLAYEGLRSRSVRILTTEIRRPI